jgi:hypothetical protein
MRRHEAPNVLFVNIGWAERYDGTQEIQGDFAFISANNGDPDRVSEGRAFLPDARGEVTCGVGRGRVNPFQSVDVVFVACNPRTRQYEIVGVYHEPEFRNEPTTSQSGNTYNWAYAVAGPNSFREFLGGGRMTIEWPRGRDPRRWARRWEHGRGGRPVPVVKYPPLLAAYIQLLATP